jgi:hypothetical protein
MQADPDIGPAWFRKAAVRNRRFALKTSSSREIFHFFENAQSNEKSLKHPPPLLSDRRSRCRFVPSCFLSNAKRNHHSCMPKVGKGVRKRLQIIRSARKRTRRCVSHSPPTGDDGHDPSRKERTLLKEMLRKPKPS